jgi:hypothetical protein
MGWSFAIVNGRLAEIYFERKNNKLVMNGHRYVKAGEFTTKKEREHIRKDTAEYRFSFRNKWYRDMNNGRRIPLVPFVRDI